MAGRSRPRLQSRNGTATPVSGIDYYIDLGGPLPSCDTDEICGRDNVKSQSCGRKFQGLDSNAFEGRIWPRTGLDRWAAFVVTDDVEQGS